MPHTSEKFYKSVKCFLVVAGLEALMQ